MTDIVAFNVIGGGGVLFGAFVVIHGHVLTASVSVIKQSISAHGPVVTSCMYPIVCTIMATYIISRFYCRYLYGLHRGVCCRLLNIIIILAKGQ